jgi:hypothetical protein
LYGYVEVSTACFDCAARERDKILSKLPASRELAGKSSHIRLKLRIIR